MRPNELTPTSAQLVRQDAEAGARGIGNLNSRLARYGKARHRSQNMVAYLRQTGQDGAAVLADRQDACGSYLLFRHYYTVDQLRLAAASFCKKHLTCPLCAIRRGAKMMARYVERYELLQTRQGFDPYMVTLTVKNGPDLVERFDHLKASYRKLLERRRDYLKKGRGRSAFVAVVGLVGAVELTNKGNGWHPHMHLMCMVPKGAQIDAYELSEEWKRITGDSYIVDVRAMYGDANDGFGEVFKYALKFSDLSVEQNWEAAQVMAGKRLVVTLGIFRGIQDDECLTDDLTDLEELPYVELFFKHIDGQYRPGNMAISA